MAGPNGKPFVDVRVPSKGRRRAGTRASRPAMDLRAGHGWRTRTASRPGTSEYRHESSARASATSAQEMYLKFWFSFSPAGSTL